MVKLQIIRMDECIGVFDPKRKKRLPNLFPTKSMEVRRPASAFESGYTTMISTDLHEQLYGKKDLSRKEYDVLRKKYGRLV